jgi:hypothetical protein
MFLYVEGNSPCSGAHAHSFLRGKGPALAYEDFLLTKAKLRKNVSNKHKCTQLVMQVAWWRVDEALQLGFLQIPCILSVCCEETM